MRQKTEKEKRRGKIPVIWKLLLALLLVLVLSAAALLAAAKAVMLSGEKSLRSQGAESAPPMSAEEDDGIVWQENWVRYEGKIYEYNQDILTFLVLGIDKMEPVAPNPDKVSGGQSDTIFLAVMNPDTKSLSLIGINRDTIVDIRMVGIADNGGDLIYPAQLSVQHGFGDGMEGSCELTKDAVSKLFYDLPIHGYVSFNMGGVAVLNDALGGVELQVLGDMTSLYKDWTEGTRVLLLGEEAFEYVHYRDVTVYESARDRLSRQKQYLTAFVQKAVEATKKDITMPVTLYNSLKDYVVTDITIDEMTYLAGELVNYSFDGDAIYTLEGVTKVGEQYEEFYPDKEALKALILQVFYREVDPQSANENGINRVMPD